MAVKIRLKRTGTTKKPYWRIIVSEAARPREGHSIEELGYYNPAVDPVDVKIKLDRYRYWVGVGAQPSDTVRSLVKKQEKAS